jgi:hypothetical protein
LNGVRLRPGDDYTATNGTSITLISAAALNDELVVDAFGSFLVANTVDLSTNQTVGGNKTFSGNTTYQGTLTGGTGVINIGSGQVYKDTSGKVGFGTTSPATHLDIVSPTNGSTAWAWFHGNTGGALPSSSINSGVMIGGNYSAGNSESNIMWGTGYNSTTQHLAFSTWNNSTNTVAERMRIDASGRVTMPYQPAFYAMMNNTNITSTAAIIFEDVYVNIGSHYNSANGRFTAPVAGTYHFSANFLKRSGSGRLLFHKNDTYYGSGASQVYQGTAFEIPMAATIIITLAAGDYINVIASIDTGDVYGANNCHNGFSGYLIG